MSAPACKNCGSAIYLDDWGWMHIGSGWAGCRLGIGFFATPPGSAA